MASILHKTKNKAISIIALNNKYMHTKRKINKQTIYKNKKQTHDRYKKDDSILTYAIVTLPIIGIIHGLQYLLHNFHLTLKRYKNKKVRHTTFLKEILKTSVRILSILIIIGTVVLFTMSSSNSALSMLILAFIIGIIGENSYRSTQ